MFTHTHTQTHTHTHTHTRTLGLTPVRGIRTTATQSETIHKYINTCATPTNQKKKKNTNSKTDVLSLIHSLARSLSPSDVHLSESHWCHAPSPSTLDVYLHHSIWKWNVSIKMAEPQ